MRPPRPILALAATTLAGGLLAAPPALALVNPTASFTVAPNPACSGETVQFDGSASTNPEPVGPMTIDQYEWDFEGDGVFDETTTSATTSHTYEDHGVFQSKLRVTDSESETDEEVVAVTVNASPVASFTTTPSRALTGQAIAFDGRGSVDLDGSVAGYQWTFGDGASATGATSTHAYSTAGSYDAKLRVTDDDGCTGDTTRLVLINAPNRPPSAGFVFFPGSPVTGDRVDFVSTSADPDGALQSLAWDLDGDGQFDDGSGATASRSFRTEGIYAIRLRATDFAGASAVETRFIFIGAGASADLLSPFPVIRVVGRFARGGTRITLLSVRAPAGSRVEVRCRGRSCPYRRSVTRVGRSRQLRIRRLQRRLRAGTRIAIEVTKPGKVGKYTHLRIRRRAAPARRDLCLFPGNTDPEACP